MLFLLLISLTLRFPSFHFHFDVESIFNMSIHYVYNCVTLDHANIWINRLRNTFNEIMYIYIYIDVEPILPASYTVFSVLMVEYVYPSTQLYTYISFHIPHPTIKWWVEKRRKRWYGNNSRQKSNETFGLWVYSMIQYKYTKKRENNIVFYHLPAIRICSHRQTTNDKWQTVLMSLS